MLASSGGWAGFEWGWMAAMGGGCWIFYPADSHFWWPRMTRTVKSYVNSCATCQRIKSSTQSRPGLLRPHDVPVRPWSHISMDLITDLPPSSFNGHTYDSIVTFVDMFSKQAHFVYFLQATGLNFSGDSC